MEIFAGLVFVAFLIYVLYRFVNKEKSGRTGSGGTGRGNQEEK